MRSCVGILACIACMTPTPALAEEGPPSPFDRLGDNTVDAFTGTSLIFHGTAVAATGTMVLTGADHEIRVAVQENLHAPLYGDMALYGGYVLPVIVPASIYVAGLLTDDREVAGAGSAAIQAVGLTFLTTVVLKVGTGRPFPLRGGDPEATDRLEHPEFARDFTPFGLSGRYAWPSGHTSSPVSIAAALGAYYIDEPAVWLIGYPVGLGIGFGMIVGDNHWASDVVGGALIGHAIGWSVGSGFREAVDGQESEAGIDLHLVPLLGRARGLAVAGRW